MARIVVSTAPTTDAKPLTAQPHATYSRGCLGEPGDRAEPQRHEHAEAQAERGEHDERDDDSRREAGGRASASVIGGRANR